LKKKTMTFKELHEQDQPLLIGNVWDVASTRVAESLGFQALGTSSAAIAAMLGYQDGEMMRFEELYFILQRIARNSALPLSVDLEAGYADHASRIMEHIRQLMDIGVVGINLEDSRMWQKRALQPPEQFSRLLEQIKNYVEQQTQALFLNIRTDTYLLNHPQALEETKNRIGLYENAGADGIFIPGLREENAIKQLSSFTSLPLNIMCFPGLADFESLQVWGVQRISMGNFAFQMMYQHLSEDLSKVRQQQSFNVFLQA
jgi:2-methylisocitrate lyase-like PEP mutase family enzyme